MGPYRGSDWTTTPSAGRDHAITPVRGSARTGDGTPADLLNPLDFPCEAVCLECGQPIRCERYYLCEWVHVERFSLPGSGEIPASGSGG